MMHISPILHRTGYPHSIIPVREHVPLTSLSTLPHFWNSGYLLFWPIGWLFPKFNCSCFIWKYTLICICLFGKMSWLGFMNHKKRNVIKTEEGSSLLPRRVDKDAAPERAIWLQVSDWIIRVTWGAKALLPEVGRQAQFSAELWDNSAMLALKVRKLPSTFREKQALWYNFLKWFSGV